MSHCETRWSCCQFADNFSLNRSYFRNFENRNWCEWKRLGHIISLTIEESNFEHRFKEKSNNDPISLGIFMLNSFINFNQLVSFSLSIVL